MLVWAHRGASAHSPENSLAAFEHARRVGADGIEMDVRLCRTGEAVVIHDPDLKRVAGAHLDVAGASLRELSRYDIGEGERIPSLEDALDACRDVLVNLEMKVEGFAATGMERTVAEAVKKVGLEERRVMISSFHPAALWRFKSLLPGVGRALLFGSCQAWYLRRGWHRTGLSVAAIHPEHTLASPRAIKKWRKQGLRVNVWTVNHPRTIREFADRGADGVITDDPALALDTLRSRQTT